ncbi:MAG: hypothetical protein K2X59_04825 [Sphingomonas sp.]|nr:hypothetical protein [Sphingomonas sp.]
MPLSKQKPPTWFWIVAVLLLLWAAAGMFALFAHLTVDAKALAAMSDYDRAFYLKLPVWFDFFYWLAVLPALSGSMALLRRSRKAREVYIVSLIGVIAQFGWVFGATDLIAVKGAAATVPFPLFIFLMAIVQVWFAGIAIKRRWIS